MTMRKTLISIVSGLALFMAAGLAVSADQPAASTDPAGEHKFEKAKRYYGECQGVDQDDFEKVRGHLKAFTDMEVMADYMADPAKFAQLMQTVYDPRTVHVMMKCATEPVMWDTWLKGLTDFDKMFRVGMRFMNPAIYMNWMMAPMNPQFWTPMMGMMDPNLWARWSTAMMNPTFYQPFFAFADPNWYTPRINWMMNPQSFQPVYGMFNIPAPAGAPAAPQPQK